MAEGGKYYHPGKNGYISGLTGWREAMPGGRSLRPNPGCFREYLKGESSSHSRSFSDKESPEELQIESEMQ